MLGWKRLGREIARFSEALIALCLYEPTTSTRAGCHQVTVKRIAAFTDQVASSPLSILRIMPEISPMPRAAM